MVTPEKGDVTSVPVNPAGRAAAQAWDPATDGSCLAYGARVPVRLRPDSGQCMESLFS